MVRPLRSFARLVALVLAAGLVYLLVTAVQVWAAAGRDGARPAEAIVVLGAAQYDGTPSPALRQRLDHAAALYAADLAPVVVVTGGKQPGDRVTEARVSDAYLQRQGVPPSALRLEVQGRSSWESLAATRRILAEEGIDDVVLVSDPLHSYRIAAIARETGMRASVSPSAGTPSLSPTTVRRLLREATAVAVGRVLGHRRLTNLGERLVVAAPLERLPRRTA
jgi:uncharacterized SAM-binding protein YcdF (DUF218 family)